MDRLEGAYLTILTLIGLSTAIYFIALLILAPYAFSIAKEWQSGAMGTTRIPVYFFAISVLIPVRVSAELILLMLILIYSIILVKTLFDGIEIGYLVKSAMRGEAREFFRNSFMSTVALTCLTIFLVGLLSTVQESAGIPTGTIKMESPAWRYILIFYSALNEEIGFRLTILGFPCFIFYAFSENLNYSSIRALKGLFYPLELTKEMNEERKKLFLLVSWTLILLTSIAFGILHYLSGAGWEVGKISLAAISSVLLGYLYIYHGFPACALSHWIFNFVTETSIILSSKHEFFLFGNRFIPAFGYLVALYFIIKLAKEAYNNRGKAD